MRNSTLPFVYSHSLCMVSNFPQASEYESYLFPPHKKGLCRCWFLTVKRILYLVSTNFKKEKKAWSIPHQFMHVATYAFLSTTVQMVVLCTSQYIYIYICFFVGGLYCIDLFFCRGCSFLIFLHKLTTSIFLLASTDRSMEKSARVSIALHSYS
jgi:hypothetical protein